MLFKKNHFLKIFWLILFSTSLAWITYVFIPQFSFRDNSWEYENKKKSRLKPGEEIQQKFIASRDNLSRIEILFPDSRFKDRKNISLKVLDSSCSKIIFEKIIAVNKLSGEKPLPFRFDKISGSEGKVFCLSLTSPENNKNLDIYLSEKPHPNSQSFIKIPSGLENKQLALVIRPSYSNRTIWKNLSELNQRISQYKPWFLKHYFLWAIIFGFILFSIILIVILII